MIFCIWLDFIVFIKIDHFTRLLVDFMWNIAKISYQIFFKFAYIHVQLIVSLYVIYFSLSYFCLKHKIVDNMEQIKLDTPLIYLTVEQFTFLLQKYLSPQVSVKNLYPNTLVSTLFVKSLNIKKILYIH